jgi:cytochrome c-type biogenesis protein CcsB
VPADEIKTAKGAKTLGARGRKQLEFSSERPWRPWRSGVLGAILVLFSFAFTPARAAEFADNVNLAPLESVEVQHLQTLKTLDSFAAQTMSAIHDRDSGLDGHSALYTVLDLSFRPEAYADQNIIKIRNVPLREDFLRVQNVDPHRLQQILYDGMVSPALIASASVQALLRNVQATAVFKADAVDQVVGAANNVNFLAQPDMPLFRLFAPGPGQSTWHNLLEISGNIPLWVASIRKNGGTPPAPVAGYEGQARDDLLAAEEAMFRLRQAWRSQDAVEVNRQIAILAAALPRINADRYPSSAKRTVEVIYNKCLMLTIPAATIYFAAFVLFLMSAAAGVTHLRLWGLRLLVVAWLVHLISILIRWWLVSTSVGNFFESIPIKNEFESVLMSAFFGVTAGLLLELRRSRGIFGAAAGFVGCLSLVAIFAAPLVFGREIGGSIGQVNGVLMSYWLYIHVTMVTASYAMITMGFCLSVWWLIKYYSNYGTLCRVPAGAMAGEIGGGRDFDALAAQGGTATLGLSATIAQVLFIPIHRVRVRPSHRSIGVTLGLDVPFLATLDLCNLVVLQLGFWLLGAGIICGAIWADQSWGRPWGWDPKETFALVTWIVYLIVVHVRVATDDKAWWTAVLSVLGFGIMLFNWIGVNFFLVGLHSYA